MHKHAHLHKRKPDLGDNLADIGRQVEGFLRGDRHQGREHGNGGHDNEPTTQQLEVRRSRESPAAATLVNVVFVTATPDFSGAIGGYTTLGDAAEVTEPPPEPTKEPTREKPSPPPPSPTREPSSKKSKPTPEPEPTTAPEPTSRSESASTRDRSSTEDSTLTRSTRTRTTISETVTEAASTGDVNVAAASASPSSTAGVTAAQQESGMSGGAKAGIAIGVILGFLALLALGFFLLRRKRVRDEEAYEKTHDEKDPFNDKAAAPSPTNRSQSMTAASIASTAAGAGLAGASLRESEKGQASNPENPFGPSAERVATPPAAAPSMVGPERSLSGPLAAGAGVAAGAAVGAAARSGKQSHVPKPLDLQRTQSPGPSFAAAAMAPMPSPSPSQFSSTSMTSTAMAAGGPAANVHRVQLDFKPSMDDELELKAGQLVRLLHEYDDGWALCIRLDRSQQGVAPRTCLSTRPVKPRTAPPNGGPPGARPPMQGPPPQSIRSVSPAPSQGPPRMHNPIPPPLRPASPALSQGGAQRSMSPGPRYDPVKRSMSPGPYGGGPQPQMTPPPMMGRPRSNSAGDVQRRVGTPGPGPSPMNPGNKVATQGPYGAPIAPVGLPAASASTTSIPGSPVVRKPLPNAKPSA